MRSITRTFVVVVLSCGISIAINSSANADMTLTAAGVAEGFALTTFATGFTHNPLGITFSPTGSVNVAADSAGIYKFSTDANNQVASQLFSSLTGVIGMSSLGNNVFAAWRGGNAIIQFDGRNGQILSAPAINLLGLNGLVTNYVTGNLIASSYLDGITFINMTTGNTRLITNRTSDGMAIDATGTIVITADIASQHVLGYRISDGARLFDYGLIHGLNGNSAGIDGVAYGVGSVIGNAIFVNTNDGRLIEIDRTSLQQTVIASGGGRGDFVTVDPYDGSLFVTQSSKVLRLYAPGFDSFGGSVPEPSSYVLLGVGLIGFAILKRRKSHSLKGGGANTLPARSDADS